MEWVAKIPQWIKIPIKILLPSLMLFSSLVLFLPNNSLEVLHLLEFKQVNGFAIGIIFIIVISLISVYILSFLFDIMIKMATRKMQTIKYRKLFESLSSEYRNILYSMYKQPLFTQSFDLADASTTYLMGISAIGHTQVSATGYTFEFYLQPWVVKSIDYQVKSWKKIIDKFERNIEKSKDKNGFNARQAQYKIIKSNYITITTKIETNVNQRYPW